MVVTRWSDRRLRRVVQQLVFSFEIRKRIDVALQVHGGERATSQQALAHSAVELEILGFAHANGLQTFPPNLSARLAQRQGRAQAEPDGVDRSRRNRLEANT